VNDALEYQRAMALAASDSGRLAEAYRLWLPLVEAGDPEAQGAVGSLLAFGLHRFENYEQLKSATHPAIDEATARADRNAGAALLAAASAAGIGPASFNLAGLYVEGHGGGTWQERKARAAELYTLAHSQGFTAFGWLMHSDGAGQPYLDVMERHMAGEQPDPPDWWQSDSGADSARNIDSVSS
jgi:TPR repeat protein